MTVHPARYALKEDIHVHFLAHLRICTVGLYASLCVRLSVTGSKFRLTDCIIIKKIGLFPALLARCKSWLVASLRVIGRCAHFNVKLLHCFRMRTPRIHAKFMLAPTCFEYPTHFQVYTFSLGIECISKSYTSSFLTLSIV